MANFSEEMVLKVWEKGIVVPNSDPDVWREDQCKVWIGRNFYGDRNSEYGWEVDHITPESKGVDVCVLAGEVWQ